MEALLNTFKDYQAGIAILSGLSAVFFLLSLLGLPWIVCQIPEDYFLVSYSPGKRKTSMWVRWMGIGVKNLLGGLFFLVGCLLLVLPGQGLLTMFLGVILMDFPGKKRLVRKLAGMEKIQVSLNWLRRKRRTKPFIFPALGQGFDKTGD